ncbi:MAG: hypothetical protein ACR2MY_01470 [Candidatus Dormibacteria bacterium]
MGFDQWPDAAVWLRIQTDLGLAGRTVDAYALGLADFLTVCQRDGIDPLAVQIPLTEEERNAVEEGTAAVDALL